MSIERIQKTLDYLYQTCGTFNCPPDFKALVISDLHLGVGDEADDFRGNDKYLCKILEDFFKQGYTLIILGDCFDLWETHDAYKQILESHIQVCALIETFGTHRRLIQLVGNHDESILYSDALKLQFPSGKIIFMTHGHRGSWACDRGSWFGRAFVRYIWAGIGQRVLGLHDPTSARVSVNPGKHEEIRQAYNGWANDRKIETIYGHLHYHDDTDWSHNTGTWIGQHRDGYTIENEQLTYRNFLYKRRTL